MLFASLRLLTLSMVVSFADYPGNAHLTQAMASIVPQFVQARFHIAEGSLNLNFFSTCSGGQQNTSDVENLPRNTRMVNAEFRFVSRCTKILCYVFIYTLANLTCALLVRSVAMQEQATAIWEGKKNKLGSSIVANEIWRHYSNAKGTMRLPLEARIGFLLCWPTHQVAVLFGRFKKHCGAFVLPSIVLLDTNVFVFLPQSTRGMLLKWRGIDAVRR